MRNDKLRQIYDLLESFTWTMKDLIKAVLDEAASADYTKTRVPAHARACFLNYVYNEIPKDHDVFEFFNGKIPDSLMMWSTRMTGKATSQEIDKLVKLPFFGKYMPESLRSADFDPALTQPPSQAVDLAPNLLYLLDCIVSGFSSAKPVCDLDSQEALKLTENVQFVMANLCHLRYPRRSNNLPVKLGLYLYDAGTARRGLDLLSKLHYGAAYRVITAKMDSLQEEALNEVRKSGSNPTSIVTYDNFEFREGRRGERIGDQACFRSITTALVIPDRLGYDQPLERAMWRPQSHLLDPIEIMDQFEESHIDQEVSAGCHVLPSQSDTPI